MGDVSKAFFADVTKVFLLTGDVSKVSALPVVIIKTNGSLSLSSRPSCARSVVSKASLHFAASSEVPRDYFIIIKTLLSLVFLIKTFGAPAALCPRRLCTCS